jgi:hypothetical protein
VDLFVGDVEAALRPMSTASKCAMLKLLDTAREANRKLTCRGASIRNGLPASTSCLTAADLNDFTKAEKPADCLTLGDAAAMEGMVDTFVSDIFADLVAPTTTTTSTTTTTL